jgi:hypothetical protein
MACWTCVDQGTLCVLLSLPLFSVFSRRSVAVFLLAPKLEFHARICVYLFELTAARDDARGKIEATRAIALTRIIIVHLSFSFFLCARA